MTVELRKSLLIIAISSLLVIPPATHAQDGETWKDGDGRTRTKMEFDQIAKDEILWVESQGSKGKHGMLIGAIMSGMDLTGVDLHGVELQGVELMRI
jgi:hypothetical protein